MNMDTTMKYCMYTIFSILGQRDFYGKEETTQVRRRRTRFDRLSTESADETYECPVQKRGGEPARTESLYVVLHRSRYYCTELVVVLPQLPQ